MFDTAEFGFQNGPTMSASMEGFLLLDPQLHPVYASSGAIEILVYPENPREVRSLEAHLGERVRALLLKKKSDPAAGFASEFKSGRRRYSCRVFSLTAQSGDSDDQARTAILIERSHRVFADSMQLAEKFNLTPRERETLAYLMQGLTSKEIAARMDISPNTVKAFLRLIMVKMGTTTRSGIVGRIFQAGHE